MSSRFQPRGNTRIQSVAITGPRTPVERLFQAPGAVLAFAAAFARDPRSVGAVAPASRWLARSVAQQLDGCNCQTLLEVGPGTGAITRELNERRRAFSRVLAVERDPWMVSVLRERYPELEIVQGCASEVGRHLRTAAPVAIVSSLPFRSLPDEVAADCIRALTEVLVERPGSMLLQYTYGLALPPFAAPSPDFVWRRVARVPMNLPPATVWRLEHRPVR